MAAASTIRQTMIILVLHAAHSFLQPPASRHPKVHSKSLALHAEAAVGTRRHPTLSRGEVFSFLDQRKGHLGNSLAAVREAQNVRSSRAQPSIDKVAPFYRSEGYTVVLEGSFCNDGNPVVYANGMPHGSAEEIEMQYVYQAERVKSICVEEGRPVQMTTILNVRSPTFRSPDRQIKEAMHTLTKCYPWSQSGRTIIFGMPKPFRHVIAAARPFMSKKQYESIIYVNNINELEALVPRHSVPAEIGGDFEWNIDEYISKRASEEKVQVSECEVRHYAGKPNMLFKIIQS